MRSARSAEPARDADGPNPQQQEWLSKNTDIIVSLHDEFLGSDLDLSAASKIEALSVKYLGENDPLLESAELG